MAVKAQAQITLSAVVDVASIWWYYKLQSSTLAAPAVPSVNPPGGWTLTEPTYTEGSTNSLYVVELTVFTDQSFCYSTVSVDSSYEAAKAAYNKATQAQQTAQEAQDTATEQGETVQATAGAVTQLQGTVNDHTSTLGQQGETIENQQSAIDNHTTAIENQAVTLASMETRLSLTEEGLSLVHKTAEDVNHYMSFTDGLVIGRSDEDTYSRYDSDGMTIIHKNVEVAAFGSDGASVPNLSIEKSLTFGGFVVTLSVSDGLLVDWNDES